MRSDAGRLCRNPTRRERHPSAGRAATGADSCRTPERGRGRRCVGRPPFGFFLPIPRPPRNFVLPGWTAPGREAPRRFAARALIHLRLPEPVRVASPPCGSLRGGGEFGFRPLPCDSPPLRLASAKTIGSVEYGKNRTAPSAMRKFAPLR